MKKIGFIGMGNMGLAFLRGVVRQRGSEGICFSCLRRERGEEIAEETGAAFIPANAEVARAAEILVLAVKPAVYPEVLREIAPALRPGHILISFAPGISSGELSESLGGFRRIVRAMPNTPAMVGEGFTGISFDAALFTEEEKGELERFFSAAGAVKQVEERLMDAVTVVGGSSPAFAYELIDALADAALRFGLKKSDALEIAAQTVMGSAKMVLESGEHPAVLRDRVCSPGGTTIAAMAALEEHGFRSAIAKGAEACYRKCKGAD